MLQLVLGMSGSGKTTYLMEQLDGRAANGQFSLFLVPEQFSSAAEGLVLNTLGEHKSGFVEVLSFRTLSERILKSGGGAGLRVMEEADRVVFVRRALDAVGDALPTYGGRRRDAAFCSLFAQTISELKTAGAKPETLRRAAVQEDEPKMAELALVFDAYEGLIQQNAMDPQDRLELAAEQMDEAFLDGRACFVDNFDGFTSPEYTLLRTLMRHAPLVCVALCCDHLAETDERLGLFSPVRAAAQRLMRQAEQANCDTIEPHICATIHRAQGSVLERANRLLAGEEVKPTAAEAGLWLTQYPDEWEEALCAAAEMHRLALAGVPYGSMALVCRDLDGYQSAVRRAFGLFGIPYFTDAAGSVEYTPAVLFVVAALELLARGLGAQQVLGLLKTGLCGFSPEEISAFENYVYTWRPNAAALREPFTSNPAGLMAPLDKAAEEQLALAEGLRGTLMPILEAFRQKAAGEKAPGVLRQLYLLLDRLEAPEELARMAAGMEERGDYAAADRLRRSWDMAVDLLDKLAALLQGERLAAGEIGDLWMLLVRATDFGQAPQSLDSVTFSAADRMRLDRPRHVFVLGLCEGLFPRQVGYSGLLTHTDREKLERCDIEMPGSFENRVLLEQMFLYRALTAAGEGLYLSWPGRLGGAAQSKSAALAPLEETLRPAELPTPDEHAAATPGAAFALLGRHYRENDPLAATLYRALEEGAPDDWREKLRLLRDVDNDGGYSVGRREAVEALVGREMTLSATRVERYYQCGFYYYMERVLRVKPLKRAELSPIESGTFVHYILEQVIGEVRTEFGQCSDEKLAELCARHAEAFLEENLPQRTRRDSAVLEQVKGSALLLLRFLRDAAAQSKFDIEALELPLGFEENALPPLEIATRYGKLRVVGKIDRVDVLRQNERQYLLVLDYKTGDRAFSLEDVKNGINMQMLIYMDALCKSNPGAKPAAVLYLSGDPAPKTGDRNAEAPVLYKLDGLLLNDAEVLRSLDADGSGVFAPVKYNKDGSPRASARLVDEAGFTALSEHVEKMIAAMSESVHEGRFDARPLITSAGFTPCEYCPYRMVCRHEPGRNERSCAENREGEGAVQP